MPSMFRKQASHGLWGSAGLKMPIHVHFSADNFDPKISQTGLVFGVQSWGLWVQDYKSLRAAGTICVTLANTETHRQTDRLTSFWPAYMNSSSKMLKWVLLFSFVAYETRSSPAAAKLHDVPYSLEILLYKKTQKHLLSLYKCTWCLYIFTVKLSPCLVAWTIFISV